MGTHLHSRWFIFTAITRKVAASFAAASNGKKIFFTDLDGTLLTDQKNISRDTFLLLKEWCLLGNKLVLCSGRALDSILDVHEKLQLHFPNVYLVGCNGGEIYDCDKGRLLYRRALSVSTALQAFSMAEKFGIYIQTYTDTHILTKTSGRQLEFYKKNIHTPVIITDDIEKHLLKEPCKCLAVELEDFKRLEAFRQALVKKLGDQAQVIYSNSNYVEIFPSGSGKGTSVTWLCNYLNIPIENSLAAGDEMNDISMLQTAHTGIAMCNGRAEVKAAAALVTARDNNHDGLVPILEKYLHP